MPSRAPTPARRPRPSPDAARREAADVLTLTAAIAAYAAGRVGNGLGPEQARRAVVDAAAELEAAAAALRWLARLTPADRRALAAELVGDGMSQRQIARTLGVSPRRAWDYLHDRS